MIFVSGVFHVHNVSKFFHFDQSDHFIFVIKAIQPFLELPWVPSFTATTHCGLVQSSVSTATAPAGGRRASHPAAHSAFKGGIPHLMMGAVPQLHPAVLGRQCNAQLHCEELKRKVSALN